jgi:chromosome segregation ATPase
MDVEKTMQFLVEQQARFDARQAELQAQFEERMTRIESVLLDVATAQERTNAILATLTEQHVELAQSHKELAQSHKKLSEAQQVTGQNLNALIATLERHIANHK